MLDIGDTVPDFNLPASGGDSLSLSGAGGPVVLFFYPRDNTPGCTTESIAFTDAIDAFNALGVTIWGVSKDSVASHDKFIAKRDLGMALLSDETSDLCEQFGVWTEKSMYGKKFMGIVRSTFLIDADRKIVQAWRKVKVPGHVDAVLEAAKHVL